MALEFYNGLPEDLGSLRGREAWRRRLLALEEGDDEAFAELLCKLLIWQGQRLPRLLGWLERHGFNSWEKVRAKWAALPAIPQQLYKEMTLYTQRQRAKFSFLTSGTSSAGERRGKVELWAMDVYKGVSIEGARRAGLLEPMPKRLMALLESPKEAPHSSLSWMVEFWMRKMPKEARRRCRWYVSGEVLDVERLARDLSESEREEILVVGTAFAWVHFLDYARGRRMKFKLHPRSRVMETGGYKGRSRELPAEALYMRLAKVLGIPLSQIWNEYGMTELASQAYARGIHGLHRAPPWLRLYVVDPFSFLPVPEGELGVVKAIDLANVDIPPLLLTADRAVARGDSLRLLGRETLQDGGRGCSLSAEGLRVGL